MARPQKEGLDYFPLDVDIDQDDKIALIEAQHGIEGFGVVIKLFMKIYSNGYYYAWTEKEMLLFKKRVNVDINLINEIINDCARWGLFDKNLFEQHKVLTSKGIQRRYLKAAERRQSVQIEKEYLLLDGIEVNDYKNLVIVDINYNSEVHDVNIYPQRIEKKRIEEESKEEESKEGNDSKGDKPPAAEAASKEPVPFKKIQELFLETCPSYPAIRAINGQRKKAVAARWNEHKDIEVFKAVFEKAEASSFLKGSNERNWAATFDWMMKPTNFLKILEDLYQEKGSKDKEPVDSSDKKAPALTGFKMATSSDEIETGPYNGHDEEEPETTQGHKLTGFKMATDPEDED